MTQIVSVPGQGDIEFPDGMSDDQISAAIRKNFPVLDAKAKKGGPELQEPVSRALQGAVETAGSFITTPILQAAGTLAGGLGAAAGAIRQGEFGTPQGAERIAQGATEGGQKLTPEMTQRGQEVSGALASGLEAAKVPPAWPMAGPMGRAETVRPAVRGLVEASEAKPPMARTPEMVGVGAAETAKEAQRRARASEYGIDLTKGQASRDFAQQQFERETAKNAEVGGPLRERQAAQNKRIGDVIEGWFDETGGKTTSLRETGVSVTGAIEKKAERAKGAISAAYEKARTAGEMEKPVSAKPLATYLQDHKAEAVNAGVLSAAAAKLDAISKRGKVTINDMEEIRKMVGTLGSKDATNAHFAGEIKKVIDASTEGQGGELYKRARSLHREYMAEFKNVGLVDKLKSTKKGTSDRRVALADVYSEVTSADLDQVRALRRTLQTGGEQGQQAWRDLQGESIRQLKESITQNVQIDTAGNRVVSPAKFDRIVDSLDKDGKLDLIFGKQGAQKIRGLREVAMDVMTSPPGSVNTSNSSSAILNALDVIARKVTGIPFVGAAIGYASKEVKQAKLRKGVREALTNPEETQGEQQLPLRNLIESEPQAQVPLKKAGSE